MKAFTWKNEGEASDSVIQRTDISGPSPPILVNLTCHNQDALYLRWKRPLEYHNSIDFYIISFRSDAQHEFQEIQFNASALYLETAVSQCYFDNDLVIKGVKLITYFQFKISDGIAKSNNKYCL